MKHIQLTQGKFAIVDDKWYEELSKHKWCAYKGRYTWYAARGKNKRLIRMHRFILGAKKGQITDHKNCNGLDNREFNIRLCTHSENLRNRPAQKNSKTKFKGVFWIESKKRWLARITYNKKIKFLGYFNNIIKAAKAYDKAAIKYFGEFAYLNLQEYP